MTSDLFFTEIEKQYQNKLPFVAYRKPNEALINALMQHTDDVFSINDYSEIGFVFAPFNSTKDTTVFIPLEKSKAISCQHPQLVENYKTYDEYQPLETDRQQHLQLVKKGIDVIKDGQIQKVVLSRVEKVAHQVEQPIEIFKDLLQHYTTAFVYFWYHPQIGFWLGATPETLIHVEGSRFKTMALAGTQKFLGTDKVVWQHKEKEEQQFVTDFIVNSLKPFTTSLTISDVETIKAGNILHLKTSISGILNLKNTSLKQVLLALHPTPAVCGLPKERAKEFILKQENYNREYYTGFLGELNIQKKITRNTNRRNVENNAYASVKKVSNLFVNLRCMQILDKKACIYVGGGITTDSDPEAEWQETVAKAEVMKKVLQ